MARPSSFFVAAGFFLALAGTVRARDEERPVATAIADAIESCVDTSAIRFRVEDRRVLLEAGDTAAVSAAIVRRYPMIEQDAGRARAAAPRALAAPTIRLGLRRLARQSVEARRGLLHRDVRREQVRSVDGADREVLRRRHREEVRRSFNGLVARLLNTEQARPRQRPPPAELSPGARPRPLDSLQPAA